MFNQNLELKLVTEKICKKTKLRFIKIFHENTDLKIEKSYGGKKKDFLLESRADAILIFYEDREGKKFYCKLKSEIFSHVSVDEISANICSEIERRVSGLEVPIKKKRTAPVQLVNEPQKKRQKGLF